MTTAWIAAAAAAVVALMSAFLTYNTTRRLSRRSDQIAFVGRQLSELYGPLYALSVCNSTTWAEFVKRYGSGNTYIFTASGYAKPEVVQAWKYWLRFVFMPIKRKILDIILGHTDLIEGKDMPKCLTEFTAHVWGYEVTLAQWEDGDYSNLTSVYNHPGDAFDNYVKEKYEALKHRQNSLLGATSKSG